MTIEKIEVPHDPDADAIEMTDEDVAALRRIRRDRARRFNKLIEILGGPNDFGVGLKFTPKGDEDCDSKPE